MDPKTDPKAKEPVIDYSDKKVLAEQITMAEAELRDFEMRCSADINFRRGNINALQAIRDGKAIITKAPEPPAA